MVRHNIETFKADGSIFTPKKKETFSKKLKETLVFGGTQDKSVTNETRNIYEENVDITKNITTKEVQESIMKLVNKAVTDSIQQNKAEAMALIVASNKLRVKGVDTGGGEFVFKGKQENDATINLSQEADQSNETKIMNSIANNIRKEMKKSNSKLAEKIAGTKASDLLDSVLKNTTGAAIGGVTDVANNVVDSLADIGSELVNSSMFGSSKMDINNIDINETTKNIKDTLNIDESTNLLDKMEKNNHLENYLNKENISECVQNSDFQNEVELMDIKSRGGNVEISPEQKNKILLVMDCVVNQKNLEEISQKIMNDISNFMETMKSTVDSEKEGEVAALGDALKVVIAEGGNSTAKVVKASGEAVSEASQGLGKGISTASSGLGDGIATASEGIFSGVGDMIQSGGSFFIILAIGAVLVIGFILYMKFSAVSSVTSYGQPPMGYQMPPPNYYPPPMPSAPMSAPSAPMPQ